MIAADDWKKRWVRQTIDCMFAKENERNECDYACGEQRGDGMSECVNGKEKWARLKSEDEILIST